MKRARKKQPQIIDVEPVEVETRALVVQPVRRSSHTGERYTYGPLAEGYIPGTPPARSPVDATGRLDIAAYRLASGYALPWAEAVLGVPGLAAVLAPWAECFIAEYLPAGNIFEAPKPRRRLR
jgi:hypothetical protein